jgi:hypothetical protein
MGSKSDMSNIANPIFHLEPKERLGDQMIEYMVALKFVDMVPECRISNITMPAWGIHHPLIGCPDPTVGQAARDQPIGLSGLASQMRAGQIQQVVWSGLVQRVEDFLPAERYQSVFRSPFALPMGYGSEYLVCPIDTEIEGAALDHPLTPVEFYRELVDMTGLTPVFIGETHPNMYMDRIRSAFKHAIFPELQSDLLIKFETIRQSKNVVVGVSTFVWLAAWLSTTAENIFMTVSGLLNPMQTSQVDLLPFGDARFKFFLFPINYAVRLESHAETHGRIAPYWRRMPHDLLYQQLRQAPRFAYNASQMVELFDQAFYLAENEDVAAVARKFGVGFARDHYLHYGFGEGRPPFRLDKVWYGHEYPLAAFEVGQGDYVDFVHHYGLAGRARGYLPYPTATGETYLPPTARLRPRAAEDIAEQILTVEVTAKSPNSLNRKFNRQFSNSKMNPFLEWDPDPHTIRSYQISDAVLDGEFRGLLNSAGFIDGTGYLLPDNLLRALQIEEHRLLRSSESGTVIIGCNIAYKNYFHWITQALPAMDFAVHRNGGNGKNILALPTLNEWQEESLQRLGLHSIPRVTIQDYTKQYGFNRIEFNEILNGGAAFCLSQAAHRTYARLRSTVEPETASRKKIYIARTDAPTRRMRNESALIAELSLRGFEIFIPGEHTLAEQIRKFRGAYLVLGPHGAGMTNVVFCEPGTIVYELLPSHYTNACFCNLAYLCGLRYWADAFESAGDGPPNLREWETKTEAVINRLNEIEAILEREQVEIAQQSTNASNPTLTNSAQAGEQQPSAPTSGRLKILAHRLLDRWSVIRRGIRPPFGR